MNNQLDSKIKQHLLWYENPAKGKRAVFGNYSDLNNKSFNLLNLSDAHFINVNARYLRFSHVRMIGSLFKNTKIKYFFISSTNISQSDFSNSNFECSEFHHNYMYKCFFNKVNLKNVSFISNLCHTDIINSKLNNVSFTESSLFRMNFSSSKFYNFTLSITNFINTNLNSTQFLLSTNINNCIIKDCSFNNAFFQDAVFKNVVFIDTDLSKIVKKSNIKFVDCYFKNSKPFSKNGKGLRKIKLRDRKNYEKVTN